MSRSIPSFMGTLALLTALSACDSASPGRDGQVSFNVATRSSAASPAGPALAPDTLVDGGGNVLVLTKVELVLRDIEFERQNHDGCDSVSTGNDDDCEEFEAGPVLIDLPLTGSVNHEFSVSVDTGTFDELKLRVHKPEDDGDAQDQAFIAAHPDLEDISIRVTGTFNGTAFTFTTDLNADEEFNLSPPIVIASQTDVAITLMVDVSSWFLNGVVLIDPTLALKGGPLESIVKNNIEASFDAFNDDDRDGNDDASEHGSTDDARTGWSSISITAGTERSIPMVTAGKSSVSNV